jgi:hypothetical protein
MFDEKEPTIEALRVAPVRLRYNVNGKVRRILMDQLTANAILAVYDAVNETNKPKLSAMLADSARLKKLTDFCWSKVSLGAR